MNDNEHKVNRVDPLDSINNIPQDDFSMSEFKMDFLASNISSPRQISRTDFMMDSALKTFIKEEPSEIASCSQLSPMSPNSSGLGSSLQSQSPHTTNSYFAAAIRGQHLSQNIYSNRADPILAATSLNIKNEALSPQSMDTCN